MVSETDLGLDTHPDGPLKVNIPEFSVSEVSSALKRTVEDTYGHVRVRGEISGFRGPHSSGHCYFALKDESAKIEAVIWKGVHGRMRFKPQEGLEIIATGKLTTYPGSSKYQIVIEAIEPAGVGALMALMEERKKKLAAEGLFDEARKQLLPWLPEVIGVVTSPTGAAIRDILHVLERRFAATPVLIYPTPVQGAAAVPGLLAALDRAAVRAECDVLIVARGGGSLEDLWAFNDERVARAIRAMPMPVVTGIGHEVDFTIADFVADLRAPTPTAAAQLAVPDGRAWLQSLARIEQRLLAGGQRVLRDASTTLSQLGQRMRLASPAVRVAHAAQRLDDLEQRLARAAQATLLARRHDTAELSHRLLAASPAARVQAGVARGAALSVRLEFAMRESLSRGLHRLDLASRTLDAVSPLATLRRGFAVVTREAGGTLVSDAATLAAGDTLVTRLAAGQFRSRVVED